MAKRKPFRVSYRCISCHAVYAVKTTRCPSCSAIYTLEVIQAPSDMLVQVLSKGKREVIATFEKETPASEDEGDSSVMALEEVPDFDAECVSTGLESVDDILGGGLFKACCVLLGGDPGTGKSTLTLQCLAEMVKAGERAMLCIAEEHPGIVKARIRRLGLSKVLGNKKLFGITVGKSWDTVLSNVHDFDPSIIAIDSADRHILDSVKGGPGSDAQKGAVIQSSIDLAHDEDARPRTVLVLSHFNGEGEFSGRTSNEHDVDTTLVMRRIGPDSPIVKLSAEGKNRFGETGFCRHLEMQGKGSKVQGLVSIDTAKASELSKPTLSE